MTSCITFPKNDLAILVSASQRELGGDDGKQMFVIAVFQSQYEGAAPFVSLMSRDLICDGMLQQYRADSLNVALRLLVEKGLLIETLFTAEQAVDLLSKKTPQKCIAGGFHCSWCKGATILVEHHHYPIPKSRGGKKTVPVCGSCHSEFHFLVSKPFYSPSQKLIDFFSQHPYSSDPDFWMREFGRPPIPSAPRFRGATEADLLPFNIFQINQ